MRKGLWSPDEDEKLVRCITKYVNGSWSDIARKAGLDRCGKSCRRRWMNHLRPDLRRGKFSSDEINLIVQLQDALGNRWSDIASHLEGRTDNDVKNLWNTQIKKRLVQIKAVQNANKSLPFATIADASCNVSSNNITNDQFISMEALQIMGDDEDNQVNKVLSFGNSTSNYNILDQYSCSAASSCEGSTELSLTDQVSSSWKPNGNASMAAQCNNPYMMEVYNSHGFISTCHSDNHLPTLGDGQIQLHSDILLSPALADIDVVNNHNIAPGCAAGAVPFSNITRPEITCTSLYIMNPQDYVCPAYLNGECEDSSTKKPQQPVISSLKTLTRSTEFEPSQCTVVELPPNIISHGHCLQQFENLSNSTSYMKMAAQPSNVLERNESIVHSSRAMPCKRSAALSQNSYMWGAFQLKDSQHQSIGIDNTRVPAYSDQHQPEADGPHLALPEWCTQLLMMQGDLV